MRVQVGRQRKEILQLQRGRDIHGIGRILLERMLTKIDTLCEQRDALKKAEPGPNARRVLGARKR